MPLAQHDFLGRTTPVSPGPPPAPVAVPSVCVHPLSPWNPVAILATSGEDGTTRILRVETPTTAEKGKTFRQAWIGEVRHLARGSDGIFPDLESAQEAAREILAKLWLGPNTPVPPVNRPTLWNEFLTELWNTPALGTWAVPVPGANWDGVFPGARWNTYGTALNWENY